MMEMLDYAIQMELDGKEYYEKQADLNKGNRLYSVFKFLANQEFIHAEILKKRKDNIHEVPESSESFNTKTLFASLDDFKSEVSLLAKQLEVYRYALEIEEKSVNMYQELYDAAEDEKDKEVYAFLIAQEKAHLEMFSELELLVRRPEEWIESAEFGLREEY